MDDTYLGDGVYASHDGYQVLLAVNHHENKVVAMEPAVLARLLEYVNKFETKRKDKTNE